MKSLAIILPLLPLCEATAPRSWIRAHQEDAIVAVRSEVIVEGRLLAADIKKIPHEAGSWEHHVRLAVTRVLKGDLKQAEIPVVIHYGLDPKAKQGGAVEIWDTGNSLQGFDPIVRDASKDHLWFLRRRSVIPEAKPGTDDLGIVDPEEVQPVPLKTYFLAYLSADPGKDIRKLAAEDPAVAKRSSRYLAHMEIRHILKNAEPSKRASKLIPYFLSKHYWDKEFEAAKALIGLGREAGPPLLALFGDPWQAPLREDIIEILGDIRYEPAVPTLIALLKEQDLYWQLQELRKDWWNHDPSSKLTTERRNNYSLVYQSVIALRKIADPSGREALETTKKRWTAINFGNPQIVDECDAALKELK